MTNKNFSSKPAKDAPIEKTKENEIFKLFSAHENDRRITPDGRLLAGTHGTTEADAKKVRSGKEAVSRFSLPNRRPASHVFTIRPRKDTLIQRGIVEATVNQPGGGEEVIFPEGTQLGTVTGPEKISDD